MRKSTVIRNFKFWETSVATHRMVIRCQEPYISTERRFSSVLSYVEKILSPLNENPCIKLYVTFFVNDVVCLSLWQFIQLKCRTVI